MLSPLDEDERMGRGRRDGREGGDRGWEGELELGVLSENVGMEKNDVKELL